MKIGLVLEGGGMRSFYTMGVLDSFMDNNIWFDYVIGISAGACSACSYLSGQRGRNYRVNSNYCGDKRYLSLRNYIKTGSFFGMNFLFEEVPSKLDPFDYQALNENNTEFYIGITNAHTGKTEFVEKSNVSDLTTILKATSSLPFFSPAVEYNGQMYYDGGVADPIPVHRALSDGCDKVVVVLTRDISYEKQADSLFFMYRKIFRKYPLLVERIRTRHEYYNSVRKELIKMQKDGKALLIMPTVPLEAKRLTKDPKKLNKAYGLGISDTNRKLDKLMEFCKHLNSVST